MASAGLRRLPSIEALDAWIQLGVVLVLIGMNVTVNLLTVRASIRRTQADACRRLQEHA